MKFEYDTKVSKNECLAFIDEEDDLCFRMPDGSGVYPEVSQSYGYDFEDYMDENGTKKKFYPGDKLTITF